MSESKERPTIKCVVWDLDNTIWDGVILEDPEVKLRNEVVEIIKTLDSRGILQSISSKNEPELALAKLKEFGIQDYFLYPQISWNPKSSSVREIARLLNISLDTFAFIDDQPYEREEVKYSIPEVLCIDAADCGRIPELPEFIPRFITEDSKMRRLMYLSDIERKNDEENFNGVQEEFLASLNMSFTIAKVGEGDLQRAEELTVRTHQLNTTGYTYSYNELDQLRKSERHLLLMAGLTDKFGTYGKIGLALVECDPEIWTIKLLLMSCRVMSRGVGTIMIHHIMNLARAAKVKLRAEFVPTDRNRMMYVTYKFAGFKEVVENESLVVFENDLKLVQPFPEYVDVRIVA